MLSPELLDKYLQRIKLTTELTVSRELLIEIHQAHLANIPFENIDITLGKPIELSEDVILKKVLDDNRGGFCYELNFALYLLLSAIGFNVTLLSARVFNGSGYGKEYDHLLLLVDLDGEQIIVDVGFGDSFQLPFSINGSVHKESTGFYKVNDNEDVYTLWKSLDDKDWLPLYIFTSTPRKLAEFEDMCVHQQTSSESNFTKGMVCTVPVENGRKTLSGNKMITTIDGVRTEQTIDNEALFYQLLNNTFGIELNDDAMVFSKFNT